MTPLSTDERALLLRLARSSIRESLARDGSLTATLRRATLTPGLERKRGAFVTLKAPAEARSVRGFELRGCIGSIGELDPLFRTVIRNAERAALHDPRFPPLTLAELAAVRIEVSALTPLTPVRDVEELVVGRDGVQLVHGGARSVFLPQVAAELGWSRDQWLAQLAIKAGLPEEAWRDGELESFRAEVFGEEAFGGGDHDRRDRG
jgi:AmmeMemoRadiSam system protein A